MSVLSSVCYIPETSALNIVFLNDFCCFRHSLLLIFSIEVYSAFSRKIYLSVFDFLSFRKIKRSCSGGKDCFIYGLFIRASVVCKLACNIDLYRKLSGDCISLHLNNVHLGELFFVLRVKESVFLHMTSEERYVTLRTDKFFVNLIERALCPVIRVQISLKRFELLRLVLTSLQNRLRESNHCCVVLNVLHKLFEHIHHFGICFLRFQDSALFRLSVMICFRKEDIVLRSSRKSLVHLALKIKSFFCVLACIVHFLIIRLWEDLCFRDVLGTFRFGHCVYIINGVVVFSCTAYLFTKVFDFVFFISHSLPHLSVRTSKLKKCSPSFK